MYPSIVTVEPPGCSGSPLMSTPEKTATLAKEALPVKNVLPTRFGFGLLVPPVIGNGGVAQAGDDDGLQILSCPWFRPSPLALIKALTPWSVGPTFLPFAVFKVA
jgi:hypothetical protein